MAFAVIGPRREESTPVEIDVEAQLGGSWIKLAEEGFLVLSVDHAVILPERLRNAVIDAFEYSGTTVVVVVEHALCSDTHLLLSHRGLRCAQVLLVSLLSDNQSVASLVFRRPVRKILDLSLIHIYEPT